MIPSTRTLLVAALAVAISGFTACNKGKSATVGGATAGQAAELPPGTVLATWGDGQKITAGELDTEVAKKLAKLQSDFDKQKFELRRNQLEQMVLQRIVKDEAAKKGMSEEQWLKQEIESKAQPPNDEELRAAYEQLKGRLPEGTTFEQIKEQLSGFVGQQGRQQRAAEVLDGLKKQANVKILFEEPRKQVEAKGPSRGPENAKVTIVEYSDFECPFCGKAKDTVDKVMEGYAGKVRLVFRNYPLPMHTNAPKAAEAALCAADQQKFWEYHDVLFAHREALAVDKLKEHAKAVGLDEAAFAKCLDSGDKTAIVKADTEAGDLVGVGSTPTFFINGRELSGAQPEEEFRRIIDEELAR